MQTKLHTRREFLWQGGAAFSGLAVASRLSSQTLAPNIDLRNPSASLSSAGAAGPRLRGLMVDAGRVPESVAYYRRVIDFCADWRLNALQFRLADDQGCAMRFSSAPDLFFHKNAFEPEQLHGLAQYALSHGVDLIPELESFGHTGYITRSPAYAHLLDADSQSSSEFTGVIPVHPETLELFGKLYREIAVIFPSAFIHGGCDEVNWGGSELSRKALQTKQRTEIWAEYLNSLNHIAANQGKQLIVWGDFVVHKDPGILERLAKNIVVMDWNYTETNSSRVHETLAKIRNNDSRAIGAPALINYRWGPRAGADQLANIDAFADAYLGAEESNSLGVILTNWVPSRYIQNSLWDGFAYAAVAFTDKPAEAHKSAFRRFVEKHYQAAWNNSWDEAFRLIYDSAPQVKESDGAAQSPPLRIPWSNQQQLAAVLADRSHRSNPFSRLRSILVQLEATVSKNQTDFRAFALSVAYLDHLYWRESMVIDDAALKHLSPDKAALAIKSIAERDRVLYETLSKDWDRGRFPDSEAKLKPLFGLEPKDQLVYQLQCAADYSKLLASQPDRFFKILNSSRPA